MTQAGQIKQVNQQAIELAVMFDATGSMVTVLRIVQQELKDAITKLNHDVDNLRIALGAFGDYDDETGGTWNGQAIPATYLLKLHDFTTSVPKLQAFVDQCGPTFGFDSPEAVEYVLHKLQTLSWTPTSKKVAVIITDETAHAVGQHPKCVHDWRQEVKKLTAMGVQVHVVQALNRSHATPFCKELAEKGNGYHLVLDQFQTVLDLISAIAYGQVGVAQLTQYEQSLVTSGKMNRSQFENIQKLKGTYHQSQTDVFGAQTKIKFGAGLALAPVGIFQVLEVKEGTRIDEFVQKNNLQFELGKGFYQLTKPEKIASSKEIVLQDKVSGDFYVGAKTRSLINLPAGVDISLKVSEVQRLLNLQYRVFIQSTSNNRKLMPYVDDYGKLQPTRFLYQIASMPVLAGTP